WMRGWPDYGKASRTRKGVTHERGSIGTAGSAGQACPQQRASRTGGGQGCQAPGRRDLGSMGRAADAAASRGGHKCVAAALLPDRSEWFARAGSRLYAQTQGPASQPGPRGDCAKAGKRAVAAGVGSAASIDPADATRARRGAATGQTGNAEEGTAA